MKLHNFVTGATDELPAGAGIKSDKALEYIPQDASAQNLAALLLLTSRVPIHEVLISVLQVTAARPVYEELTAETLTSGPEWHTSALPPIPRKD